MDGYGFMTHNSWSIPEPPLLIRCICVFVCVNHHILTKNISFRAEINMSRQISGRMSSMRMWVRNVFHSWQSWVVNTFVLYHGPVPSPTQTPRTPWPPLPLSKCSYICDWIECTFASKSMYLLNTTALHSIQSSSPGLTNVAKQGLPLLPVLDAAHYWYVVIFGDFDDFFCWNEGIVSSSSPLQFIRMAHSGVILKFLHSSISQ